MGDDVCLLSRQSIYVTPHQFEAIAKKYKATIKNEYKPLGNFLPGLYQKINQFIPLDRFISDIEFFNALGFSKVESIDFSDWESPTYVHDLNLPVPASLHSKYDLIIDAGTIEHIFNIPECLKNLHLMLKPGGIIIHSSPANNHVDHGFYVFSPQLFFDYYSVNGYEILDSKIYEYEVEHSIRPTKIYEYRPGSIDHLSVGGWKKPLATRIAVRKNHLSTEGIIPQQGAYLRGWQKAKLQGNKEMQAPVGGSGISARLRKSLKKYPNFYMALKIINYLRLRAIGRRFSLKTLKVWDII